MSSEGEGMIDEELLRILACPVCKGSLKYDQERDRLICPNCRLMYRIENDIPVMLVDEAGPFSD
jgi:hypothetical protein